MGRTAWISSLSSANRLWTSEEKDADDWNAVCFVSGLLDLCFRTLHPANVYYKACLVGGVYAGRWTFRNRFQMQWLGGEPVAYTAWAKHSSAFLGLRSSIELKNPLIPEWPGADERVSESFSLWMEAEELAWGCLFWALVKLWSLGHMLLHLRGILNIELCTVFASVHSLSVYIGWGEMSPHIRWRTRHCSVE